MLKYRPQRPELEPAPIMVERDIEEVEISTAVSLARAGWATVLDRLLVAVVHDLNGRAMALDGVSLIMAAGGPFPEAYGAEIERLLEVARVVSLLPGSPAPQRIPAILPEALAPVVALHDRLTGNDVPAAQISADTSTPPVLIDEGRFRRAMLLFLDKLGVQADGDMTLTITGDVEGATISTWPPAAVVDARAWQSLAEVFSLDGGVLELDGDVPVLRIPSLAVARGRTG